MKRIEKGKCISVVLAGVMVALTGCGAESSSTAEQTETTAVELPPLVTESDTQGEEEETIVTTTCSLPIEESYPVETSSWELPSEMGEIQTVHCYGESIYVLGIVQDKEQAQSSGIIYQTNTASDEDLTRVYDTEEDTNFIGLTDFDVMSDGTICGLICDSNTILVGNEEEDIDWETYYSDNPVQYRLVWYDQNGQISKKIGLSSVLNTLADDQQVTAFTGVRSDDADHIYLTATVEDREYLMALDDKGNLCPVQGNSQYAIELDGSWQLMRSGKGGMLLSESDSEGAYSCSHIVVTDGALWKTQTATEGEHWNDGVLAEDATEQDTMSFWNQYGLYRSTSNTTELLFSWNSAKVDQDSVTQVMILSETDAVVKACTSGGNTELMLVHLDINNETESTLTEGEDAQLNGNNSVPVATPTTQNEKEE